MLSILFVSKLLRRVLLISINWLAACVLASLRVKQAIGIVVKQGLLFGSKQ